ncbi:MAG: transcription termination factor NusA [Oscillospiraceae bacterium]
MAKKKTAPKENETAQLFDALIELAQSKGIPEDVFIAKIAIAIKKSVTKSIDFGDRADESVVVTLDTANKIFEVCILKEVVDDKYYTPDIEISLADARNIDPTLNVGDFARVPIDTHDFKRFAAKEAKDLIRQGFCEVERQHTSEVWGVFENEAVPALVVSVDTDGNAILDISGRTAELQRNDQLPDETLVAGQVIKVYITGVSRVYKEGDKRQNLRITRTDKGLIKRLFELECPEIADGTVEIKSVSRAPGSRSKIAVVSHDPNVDPVGACIGPQKSRINAVTKEIKGEKVDVVLYSDDPQEYIAQALKPAEVTKVIILPDLPPKESGKKPTHQCRAIVPDNQLSLAIGNKGQNAMLAAKLTEYKIDIIAESKAGN